jgi:GNAT superfamily N-acetyltransferase
MPSWPFHRNGAAPDLSSLMSTGISVAPLALHPEAVPVLRAWFAAEWPGYYGPGGPGSAQRDLEDYAHQDSLPVGVIALMDGEICGVAALKAESIASHAHLSPWAAAGLVHPSLRGRGIGRLLLGALEEQARKLGFRHIYCGTSTAHTLLQRCGWELIETISHEGESLGIHRKAL